MKKCQWVPERKTSFSDPMLSPGDATELPGRAVGPESWTEPQKEKSTGRMAAGSTVADGASDCLGELLCPLMACKQPNDI